MHSVHFIYIICKEIMCCVFYSYVIFLNLLSFVITPNSVPAYHLIKTVFQQIERKKTCKVALDLRKLLCTNYHYYR